MKAAIALLLSLAPLAAQPAAVRTGKLHGRDAWILENAVLRASILRGGGFIGELRMVSPDPRKSINPMRVPHYDTIDPFTYDPARHDAIYGIGTGKRLMSGYMGSFLCFPNFGPPSSKLEFQNGVGDHGEALAVEWKQAGLETPPGRVILRLRADLPLTQYRVERAFILADGEAVLQVEESVENLAAYDRPINWVQHVTFGPPFAEPGRNFVDAPVKRVSLSGSRQDQGADWPEAATPSGQKLNLRQFQPEPKSGGYRAWLLDTANARGWMTAYHSEYPVLFGMIFSTSSNPWIGDWQENQRATERPWDGKVIARGMEVGNTPYAEGLRRSVERGALLGAPAYRWIGAREKVTQTYSYFLAEIPTGFRGVSEVRAEPGIVAIPRDGGPAIPAKSSRGR